MARRQQTLHSFLKQKSANVDDEDCSKFHQSKEEFESEIDEFETDFDLSEIMEDSNSEVRAVPSDEARSQASTSISKTSTMLEFEVVEELFQPHTQQLFPKKA